MAKAPWESDEFANVGQSPAAPSGLQQQAQQAGQYAKENRGALPPWLEQGSYVNTAQDWYTGANQQGTNSGYDITNGWMEKMQRGYTEAADQGTLRKYYDFAQSGSSGIATYDYESDEDEGGTKRKYRFGDIYEDGEFKGNIYDKDSGFDQDTANLLMSDLMFDAKTKAEIFTSSDRQERLDQAVQERREKNNVDIPKFLSAAEFQEDVKDRQESMQEGLWDDIVSFAGGAIGGGIVGSAGGPIGAFGGGLVGGVGAWLNRDELSEAAARASLITEMADRDFGTIQGIFTGIQQYSGLAGKMFTPLGNTVHGLYDAIEGTTGDGESSFYAMNDKGEREAPLWLRGLDLAAGVGDSLGQFASPVGRMAYMTTMTGTIVGETGMLATTGSSFDDRQGAFDNVFKDDQGNFDPVSAAAGIGKVGIDAVQLGMARGLVRKAESSRVFAGLEEGTSAANQGVLSRTWDRVTRRPTLQQGEKRVEIGGYSYTMRADGTIAEGSRRATVSLLAPSEQLSALSAGNIARRQAAVRGGAVTADDYYRAAVSLTTGEHKIRNAMVNAFGEGYEEGVQAILEPMSHNAAPDAREVWESAAQGFTMGLGMSLGISLDEATSDQKMYALAKANHYIRTGGQELSKDAWKQMTGIERRAAAAMAPEVDALAKAAFKKIEDEQKATMTASVADVAKLTDAMRSAQDKALARLTQRTDGTFQITQLEDAGQVDGRGQLLPGSMPSNAVASSANQLAANLEMHAQGLQIQQDSNAKEITSLQEKLAKTTDEQVTEDLQARMNELTRTQATVNLTLEMAEHLNQAVQEMATEIRVHLERGDQIAARATVEELNRLLANAFDRKIPRLPGLESISDEQALALARAATLPFSRSPEDQSGSFQALLPQANWTLTREGVDNLLQVDHAILAPLSGDYDGDRIRQRAQLVLDDAAFARARTGANLLGAGESVNIGTRDYEKWNFLELARASASGNDTLTGLATHFLEMVGQAVRARYQSYVPAGEIEKALGMFAQAATQGSDAARQKLIDELARRGGDGIMRRGAEGLSNEWLWLDQVVTANLQEFQRAYASFRPDLGQGPNTEVVLPNRQTRVVREREAAKAATLGQTLGIWTEGPDMFRSFQQLHYTAYNAGVLSSKDVDPNQLTQLVELYEALGQRVTRSELDNIRSKDDITGTVLAQLNRMAATAGRELGLDTAYAPVILANVQVQDFRRDEQGNPTAVAGKITLAQLLLRRAVERDQIEKAGVIDRSPELQAKHARLLGMTRPGKDGVNAERAFLEVFGATPLYELLGNGATIFGPHLTPEQFLRKYESMHENDRREAEKALKTDPEYLAVNGRKEPMSAPYNLADLPKGVTAYRAVLDSLLHVGRYELGVNKQGHVVGAKAERSRQVSKDFHGVYDQIRAALTKFRQLSPRNEESDPHALQRMLEQNPDFARRMLELIPDSAAAASFELRDGSVYIADWFYETFAQPDAKAAEMFYWRNLLLAEWNAKGGQAQLSEEDVDGEHGRQFSKLTRRMHRVMYKLAAANDQGKSLLKFLNKLTEATDLETFMEEVNRDEALRGRQAPLLAWVDDTADFDPDKAGGGWAVALPGADLRESVGSLREATQRLVQSLSDEKRAWDVDRVLISTLEKVGTDLETDEGRRLAERLDKVIDLAGEQWIALGPAAMVQQTVGSLLGFYPSAHTKGQNPPPYAAAGAFDALRDAFDYTTNFERVLAGFTTYNLDAVGGNLSQAAKDDLRTMDDDGNVVTWKKPTREKVLELLSDPDTRAFARGILFPTVMETTLDGRLSPQFLVGKSLQELLDGASMDRLFRTTETGTLRHEAAMTYASMLEARTRAHKAGAGAVQRVANDLTIARTSALDHVLTASEAERMTTDAYFEIAQLMQSVGSIVSDERARGVAVVDSQLHDIAKDARTAARRMQRARVLQLKPGEERELTEIYFEDLIKAREKQSTARIKELEQQYAAATSVEERARIDRQTDAENASFEKFEKTMQGLLADDQVSEMVLHYTIPPDPIAAIGVKRELLDYVKQTGTLLQLRVPEVMDLYRKISNQLLDANNNGSVELTDEEWDELSRAVIAVHLEDTAMIAAPGVAVPLFPDLSNPDARRYYDPSWAYLTDKILDPGGPLAQAAADLHEQAGRLGEVDSRSTLLGLLGRTVFDEDRLGDWSTDIVRSSNEANKRLDAAAAAFAISMAGNSPKRQAVISAATRRTFEQPGEELLSTVSLNFWSMRSADLSNLVDIELATAQGKVAARRPLAQLNNRFARSAVLTYTDDAGEMQSLDLMTIPNLAEVGFSWTAEESVGASGYKVISLSRLQRAVDNVMEQLPDSAVPIDIKVEFFHPDSQPPEAKWMNNIYFEGTIHELPSDDMDSLNAAGFFLPGGLSQDAQRMALDANKLGKPALQVLDPVSAAEREAKEKGWREDFSAMLRAKTDAMMAVDLGDGQLDPTMYNFVYKNLKLRHFVRGTFEGRPVIWTAEQVIARQLGGESLADVMPDAELWVPSDNVLVTMLGEQGDQGTANYTEEGFDPNLANVPNYRGVTPEMMEQLSSVTERSLESTRITARARQTQLTVRSRLPEATLNAYDMRIQRLDVIRSEGYQDRATLTRNTEGGFNPVANLDRAVRAADGALNAEDVTFDWGRLGIPWGPRSSHNHLASSLLLKSLAATQSREGYITGWVYQEAGESNPAKGLLTKADLDRPSRPGMALLPGDLVVVELDSFRGNRERAEKVLRHLVDRGVNIVLGETDGGTDARVEAAYLLQQIGYERIAGSVHVYQPLEYSPVYQNRRARESTLLETKGVTTKNKVAVFLTRGEHITENAAWVVEKKQGEREALRSVAATLNLLKTDFLADVNVPVGPQIDAVRAKLEYMLGTEQGRKLLRQQSRKDKLKNPYGFTLEEATTRLLERWETSAGTVLPEPGQEFGTGDIIPLVDGNGRILLYRHGHKAPTRDQVLEMWNQPLPDEQTPYGIAVYPEAPEDNATVHTGEVVAFQNRAGHGLSVELNVPLSIFGDKKQLEWNGMKYVLGVKPESFQLPEHPMFTNGWGIDIIADVDSAFSKESYGGMVNNHRNAFAYFGIDFMPYLEKFFGLNPAQVRELLGAIAKGADRISVAQAHDIIGAAFVEPALVNSLQAFTQARPDLGVAERWAQQLSDPSPEAAVTTAVLAYLMTPGRPQLNDILQSGGFNSSEALTGEGQSRLMPQLFTQLFDAAPLDSELRSEMNKHFNRQLSNPNKDGTGYVLHPDWTFEILTKGEDGRIDKKQGILQFAEAHSSGDNPIKNGMSFNSNEKQSASLHSQAIPYLSIGAETAFSGSLERAQTFLTDPAIVRLRDEKDGGVWRMLTDIPQKDSNFDQWRMPTPLEQERRALAREAVVGFRQSIDQSEWSESQKTEYQDLRLKIVRYLGLTEAQVDVVDFWVRQAYGMPVGEAELPNGQVETVGKIGSAAAVEGANDIWWNVSRGYLPTVGAEVPQLHLVDLQMLYRANENRPRGWKPRVDVTANSDYAKDWDDWVTISLGSARLDDTSIFDPMFLLATDGFMHSYQGASSSLLHLPVSRDALVAEQLLDPDNNRLLVSLSGDVNTLAVEPMILDTAQASLAQLIGGTRIGGRYKLEKPPASEVAKRRAKRRQWRRENNMPYPLDVTMRSFRKNGRQFIDHGTNTNTLFRMLNNLRVGTALINPALYISAGPEMWFRNVIDTVSNLLTGQATVGRTARLQARINDRAQGKEEGFLSALTGGGMPYTSSDLDLFRNLYEVLGQRQDFKSMIFRELMYIRPYAPGVGKVDRALESYAKFGSRLQDPTWGMKGHTLARRYIEAAMQHIMAQPTENVVSLEALAAGLRTNPQWLQDNFPDAHRAGANAIAQIRSLKQTPLSLALKGIYEPMSSHPNGVVNGIGNVLLKLPLMFSGYAMNVATTITGMQGASDMLAMYLDRRNNRFTQLFGRASALAGKQKFDAESWQGLDMSTVIEGIDLSRSFIRGGVTLTGLFTMGLMMGGLGLSGEDDEMKRRRRAAELQAAPVLYDPRKVENDFRNADAWFLDAIPGLDKFFGIGGEGGRSMANIPWVMRQFVSPMMGFEKFLETGDPRQITWGFQDAISSFPLINSIMWDDAVATFDELMKEADDEGKKNTPDGASASMKFLINGVATYERMLFENSFANAIYAAVDRYDRDPYALPALTDTGDARQMYTPNGSEEYSANALNQFVDPRTGEVREGYMGRDFAGTQLRILSENRATLGILGSLFTGKGLSGDTIRFNMPVKTREFDKPEITDEQARAIVGKLMWDLQGGAQSLTPMEIRGQLIERNKAIGTFQSASELDAEAEMIAKSQGVSQLSVIDKDGYESLTKRGAAAVLQGLTKGTVSLDDEALRGIHITFEQREQIQAEWMEDLVQEGLDLGLSRSQSEYRMYRIWNGPSTNPEVLGIKDILWSDKISYSKNIEFKQLNTTYVTGPDGLPWATGFTRGGLTAGLGIVPTYQWGSDRQGGVSELKGALGQDARLNVQDFANGINTGLRALEATHESAYIPGAEEIKKSIDDAIEAIKKLDLKPTAAYDSAKRSGGYGSGYRRFGGGYGRRRSGGYSGGGSGYYTRLNPLPNAMSPYGNTVPFINTSNPYIRRANIRRERVSSQRGRLNQWQ